MKADDREILTLLTKSDTREKGFAKLIEVYQRPLYARIRSLLICHADADDALQNTFVKVYTHIGNFKGRSSLYTWLYRIATNEAMNVLRDKARTTKHIDFDSKLPVSAPEDLTGPGPIEIAEKLRSAVATLPDKQRQIFEMRYFGEMPYKDIAALTNTSVGALKAGYFHAVRKIEKQLVD